MIGFPARSGELYECASGSSEAARMVAKTFEELGWEHTITEEGVFRTRIGISLLSYGEVFTVEILEHGLIRAASRCIWPMQLFDWGKNRSNVRKFLDHLRQKEIRYESLGPGEDDHGFEADNSSRIEKLFAENNK